MRTVITRAFFVMHAACKAVISFFSTLNISFILASASLVTSLTTLLIVPNGLFKWWTHRHWHENIKIIRLNTNDYTYVYNGNYDPVFFDRLEIKSIEMGKMNYLEVGKAIEGRSYLVFIHKGVAFEGMYQGSIQSLFENGKLPEKYQMVPVNIDHPMLKAVGVGKPTLYETEAKMFFNFGLESKEIAVQAKSFVVSKSESRKESSDMPEQPSVQCDYTPKFDIRTGKKIE